MAEKYLILAIVAFTISFHVVSIDAKKAACSCDDDQRTETACKQAGGRIVMDPDWGSSGSGSPVAVCIFRYEPDGTGNNGFGENCGRMACASQVNDPSCA